MAVRKLNPVTPGQRFRILSSFEDITNSTPEKSLLAPKKSTGGRNSSGRMTMRYNGGGHKQQYRIIDFKRDKDNIPAKVKTIEYDPNRSARIALLFYADGEKRYILAPNGLKTGQVIVSGGSMVHNIELRPGQGGAIARSAGTGAQLTSRDGKYAIIKLPSGETRMILVTCRATVGAVSNSDHGLERSGKAGRSRWLGRRPRTRGVAMNPVDHPMGGGEGRASGGHPRSRKGIPAKGYITRSPKNPSNRYIIERRKKNK